MEMELETRAKVERLILDLVDLKEQKKSLSNKQEFVTSKLISILEAHEVTTCSTKLETGDYNATVEIIQKSKNVLLRDKIAEALRIAKKEIKTKTLIRKAQEGTLTLEDFESFHITEVNTVLKLKVKKNKPPKKSK